MSPQVCFLADEMLGKLARELRVLGYDAAYAHGMEDEDILAWARREDRLLLTRDRHLADVAGSTALLLRSRQVEEQVDRVVEALELSPSPEAFLSRCLECNEVLAEADDPDRLPDAVGEKLHWRCPSCDRVYWQGTHAHDMFARLGEHLPDDADLEQAVGPSGRREDAERKP